MASIFSRFGRSLWNTGKDSLTLAGALGRGVVFARSPAKSVLLDQARIANNNVAIRLLQAEQQIGLIRYHGFPEYAKQHLLPASMQKSTLASGSDEKMASSSPTETAASSSSTSAKAKIAFMITGTMRSQLVETLNYTPADIKSMTPLEASLILHNQVTPDQREGLVPQLLQNHQDQQDEERERVEQQQAIEEGLQRQQRIQAIEELKDSQKQEEIVETPSELPVQAATSGEQHQEEVQQEPTLLIGTAAQESQEQTITDDSKMKRQESTDDDVHKIQNSDPSADDGAEQVEKSKRSSPASFGEEWYELIEIKSSAAKDGLESSKPVEERVGLYSNPDEAEIGLDTKQFIADREELDVKYEVRRVPKSQLWS